MSWLPRVVVMMMMMIMMMNRKAKQVNVELYLCSSTIDFAGTDEGSLTRSIADETVRCHVEMMLYDGAKEASRLSTRDMKVATKQYEKRGQAM